MKPKATKVKWPGTGLGFVMGCLFFVAVLRCEAQGNLVPNPSFEQVDTCFSGLGFTADYHPESWMAFSPTPDHHMGCQPDGWLTDVPYNIFTYQQAKDGMAYCGMWSFARQFINTREMVGARLIEPLVVGETYYASMFVNAAYGGSEEPGLAIDRFGMVFSVDSFGLNNALDPTFGLRNYAQVYSQEVILDTADWTLVEGSFVADSAYQFLVIGNHFSDAMTDTVRIGPGYPWAYVLVDQVCVSASPECSLVGVEVVLSDPTLALWVEAEELVVSGMGNQACDLMIVDAHGSAVVRRLVPADTERLHISGLAQGVYTAVLSREDERVIRKFVVVR
ncbi:MAG: hypothetical protein IT225_05485 [Flavobacteriales bacterium]|jgi:hypothetical protein|nr:hypothetical protein [Flavobacteriales bacterium]TXI82918.1 MAG: hypothetical protein E6Q44_00475 [Flavobacteriales bacterium]